MQFRATFSVPVSGLKSLFSRVLRFLPVFPSALLALALGGCTSGRNQATLSLASESAKPAAPRLRAFGQMPLYFVENRGQIDSRAAYYLHGKDKAMRNKRSTGKYDDKGQEIERERKHPKKRHRCDVSRDVRGYGD